jgi:hypothetical protein
MSNIYFCRLDKNNLSHILDVDGDISDTLELNVILLQILNTHYPFLDKCSIKTKINTSLLAHKIHFKRIIETKISLRLKPTAQSYDTEERPLNWFIAGMGT